MTAHLTDALERAEQFDADLWRRVIESADESRLMSDDQYARCRYLVGLAERINGWPDGPAFANHLMLAVAAALVPSPTWQILRRVGFRYMPGPVYAAAIWADNGMNLGEGEASTPANALASAAIKARAPEAGK